MGPTGRCAKDRAISGAEKIPLLRFAPEENPRGVCSHELREET